MKFLFSALILITNTALASTDCTSAVRHTAELFLPPESVQSVQKTPIVLAPNDESPAFSNSGITNNSDHPVQVYLVTTAYMGKWSYAFLVDPRSCQIESYFRIPNDE